MMADIDISRRSLVLSSATGLALLPAGQGRLAGKADPTDVGSLFLSQFGAALDGTTDDSGALQRAVDACLKASPAHSLIVDGPCRLERSVFIDRPVDRTRGVFRVIGAGPFGGFIGAGNFAIFDSRLSHATAPMSEHIWFKDIRFEAVATAPLAQAMSDKFLRVRFLDCEFERIRALAGSKYAQEWHFSRCLAQRWSGVFFLAYGGYHIVSNESKYQNGGGDVFRIVDPALQNAGCVGSSFHQDVAEANTGSFLKAAVVQGLSVAGLYSEGNHGPTLHFDNAAANRGISVTGCMFASKDENKARSDFFDILWGRIEAGHASGNYSTGRLHYHRAASPTALTISGDYAAMQLVKEAS